MQAEQQLIEKILSGDMNAFQTMVENYQRLVCHIVFRMVKNEEDREEICQDVFFKVYKNLDKFEYKSKLSTWISRIAYNTSINYLKKKKLPLYDDLAMTEQKAAASRAQKETAFIEQVSGKGKTPDEWMMNKQAFKHLQAEIDDLPPKFRTILTLYHIDELSYQEICEIMSLPEGTVKSYLFRARKLLKERMLEKFPAEELW